VTEPLDALVDICGPDYARVARSVDVVGGRRAGYVAVPATSRAVADLLRLAAGRGLTVLPRGSGSKIDWGAGQTAPDLIIDSGRLSGMWDHDEKAMTAEVGSGTPVHALRAALALRGQRLPVEPPSPTATVGGVLAVGESGPLRYAFGTPAEQVLRVSYVDPAGRPGEAGHAEVPGVITSAVLRLRPLPAARRWVTVIAPTPLQIAKLAARAAEHDPAAIETDLPPAGPVTVAALFEGEEDDAVAARAAGLAGSWGDAAVASTAPPWWGRYPFDRSDVVLRLSVSPPDLPATVYALADAVGHLVPVRGSAGLGNVHAVLPGTLPPHRVESVLESLRHVLIARNGHAVVIAAPPALAARIEMATRHDLF